jgi:hypothetical protein
MVEPAENKAHPPKADGLYFVSQMGSLNPLRLITTDKKAHPP